MIAHEHNAITTTELVDNAPVYSWTTDAHERPGGDYSYEATVRLVSDPRKLGVGWGDSREEARAAALVDLDGQAE